MTALRVGIIGYGYTGKIHAQACLAQKGARLVAIADADSERVKDLPSGVRACRGYEELLESGVDAVSICLPTHLHCKVAVDALGRGKHVLVEKPIAVSLEEAQCMLRAAKTAGRVLYVGMTHRFYPEMREAKKLIDDGAIGSIVACNDCALEHIGFLNTPPWYMEKKFSGGGPALTSGIHLVDRLRWFTGDEVRMVAGSAANPYFGADVEDAGQMFLRFRGGISAQITVAFMREPHPLVCDLQVIGTRGSITVHTWRGYDLWNASGHREKIIYTDQAHRDKVQVGIEGEMREFSRASLKDATRGLRRKRARARCGLFWPITGLLKPAARSNSEKWMPFDLLLRGGRVVDPSQSLQAVADVGIRDGRIAQVGPNLDGTGCLDVREIGGKYVCPGLIDLHGHWYEGNLYGVDPLICLNHGVTTAVDAGSTGYANFPEFRRTVLDRCLTDVLAFVHIAFMGLHAPYAEELMDLRYARPRETAAVIGQHRERAIGVKLRMGSMTADHGLAALDMALAAASEAAVPLMVHISSGAEEAEILRRLRLGDILTHCFHGRGNGMIHETIIPEAREARNRGVYFDVGHGCGSFSWETARQAFEHHFYPDTISTDLHRYCAAEPLCVSLPQVMSKMLCLGMSLEDAILKTTAVPARILGREREIGTLAPGAQADVLVFDLETGDFPFADTHLKVRIGSRSIAPHLAIKRGRAYAPGSFPVKLRELYESDMDVFRAIK